MSAEDDGELQHADAVLPSLPKTNRERRNAGSFDAVVIAADELARGTPSAVASEGSTRLSVGSPASSFVIVEAKTQAAVDSS